MCTLTWQTIENGYRVLFTRDEQRSRHQALLPEFDQKLAAVYPVDPQGQGTWIASNQHGQTWCLLNLYSLNPQSPSSTQMSDSKPRSRGQIILEALAHFAVTKHPIDKLISDWLQALCLAEKFTPFTLCYFPSYNPLVSYQPKYWQWNGTSLSCGYLNNMFTSSGKLFSAVKQNRQQVFTQIEQLDSNDRQWAFHQSHLPEKCHLSTCMHRSDAKSVSITEVVACANSVTMSYWQNSPCQANYQQPDRQLVI